MPRSSLRHPVAVLRKIINLSAAKLSKLAEVPPDTLRSVECGRLKLSEDVAFKISSATGVDSEWLLNGDPSAEPVDSTLLQPYTVQIFKLHRMTAPAPMREGVFSDYTYLRIIAKANALFSAFPHTHSSSELLAYKVEAALDAIANEQIEKFPQAASEYFRAIDIKNSGEMAAKIRTVRRRFQAQTRRSYTGAETDEPLATSVEATTPIKKVASRSKRKPAVAQG